jgi:hypothetical protein
VAATKADKAAAVQNGLLLYRIPSKPMVRGLPWDMNKPQTAAADVRDSDAAGELGGECPRKFRAAAERRQTTFSHGTHYRCESRNEGLSVCPAVVDPAKQSIGMAMRNRFKDRLIAQLIAISGAKAGPTWLPRQMDR